MSWRRDLKLSSAPMCSTKLATPTRSGFGWTRFLVRTPEARFGGKVPSVTRHAWRLRAHTVSAEIEPADSPSATTPPTRFCTRAVRLLAALSGAAALALTGLARLSPCAAVPSINAPVPGERAAEPASEGRPITPAGVLIKDAATGRPAVLPLTVDFVRSTDEDGPDGKGRYLIAINSGYGIEFSGDTNKAQQSLSVIDLGAGDAGAAAQPVPVVIQNV